MKPVCIIFFSLLPNLIYSQSDIDNQKKWLITTEYCKVYNPTGIKRPIASWSGDCIHGIIEGEGALELKIGEKKKFTYEGVFTKGLLNGYGIKKRYNNSGDIERYSEGNFENSKLNGEGSETYFYDDGDSSYFYQGTFKNDYYDGQGKEKDFYSYKTVIYEGEYKYSWPDGQGESWTYVGGKVVSNFKGTFTEDKKETYTGVLIEGYNKYIGEWKSKMKHGIGKLYFKERLIYDGEWAKNKFDGFGIRIYNDSSIYVGTFKKNYRHGFGIIKWADQSVYVGEFSSELFQGIGFIRKNSVNLKIGLWEKGNLVSKEDESKIMKKIEDKYSESYNNSLSIIQKVGKY